MSSNPSAKKKKIGFIAAVSKNSGGIFQYTQSMLDAISKIPNVEVIVFSNEQEFMQSGQTIRPLGQSDNRALQILRWFALLLKMPSKYLLSRETQAAIADIDYFICPYISHFPHYWSEQPYLLAFHDLQEKYFPHFFSRKERLRRWMLGRSVAMHANQIICESNFVKQDLVKFLAIPSERVTTIPSPPPLSWLTREDLPEIKLRTALKLKLPKHYLFYPAQFWPHKNHEILLKALAELRKTHTSLQLVLTGTKQNYFNQVIKLAEELKLRDALVYPGYVSEEELMGIYLNAFALVMPSHFESISIPVYEAFALGVPVCCSNAVGLAEQVGSAGLLFSPESCPELVDCLRQLLSSPSLGVALASRGKERLASLSHEKYATALAEIIRKTP